MARRVASFIALALSARIASAHYIFQQLSVGGTTYPTFQYIRKNSNYNSPVTELSSPDLRCNVGASGSGTATIAVNAGASFTFTLDTPVYHQGPISIYLSKAPGAAADYDGSGGWFKIKDFGPTFSSGSSTWPMSGSYTYTLPTCLANGDYLLRIQSLAIHKPWPAGIPQFYISCAQITVSGGSGTLNPSTVSIPGTFKETDPGYTANIYSNFNSYTVPGPAPVACGSGGGGDPPVTTTARTTLATTTRTSAAPTTTQNTNCAALYGQCGGNGWTGPTCCSSGTCKKSNDFYSQCL